VMEDFCWGNTVRVNLTTRQRVHKFKSVLPKVVLLV
jgi:hypothetical protein